MAIKLEHVVVSCFAPNSPPVDSAWHNVYRELTAYPPLTATNVELNRVGVHRMILAEVIRLRWDSKFRIKASRKTLEYIKALGAIANALLDVMSAIQEAGLIPDPLRGHHQAWWFGELLREGEAIGIEWNGVEIRGKDHWLRHMASQNRRLRRLENPFSAGHTKEFFETAIAVSERYDQIAKKVRAFANARAALGKSSLSKDCACYKITKNGSMKEIRQGRLPKHVHRTLTG